MEWRPILDFPNYEVSNNGLVRNNQQKLLSINIRKRDGYCEVGLSNGKGCKKKVHRLVAEAFIPNPENKPLVDHIDRNVANNMVDNLRWATYGDNALNTSKRELYGIHKKGERFEVCFKRNYKNNHYGHCKTLEEAIILRDNVLNTLHSSFLSNEP